MWKKISLFLFLFFVPFFVFAKEDKQGNNISSDFKVKFDREIFIDKLNKTIFPDKKNIMKYFYGIDIN